MGIIGVIIILVSLYIGLRAVATSLIDIPSALVTFGPPVALLLFSFGSKFGRAIKTVFKRDADGEDLLLGVFFFERAKTYVVVSGVLGTLIGLIIIWNSIDDPAALGPGMALGLLTQIYPIMLAFGIILPVVASLRRRLEEAEVGG